MSTLFDQQLTDASGALGVIGDRQLVVVQTFYIARLTSHPVAIVPSSFVAVTGRGPRDSNESGKTSFNAAVSLLLGDPEWRVTGGGVAAVAQLLFEPDTAGVAATRYPAADTGFIIGVFANPDDPAATAHTVWMKLSSRPKYVQVRHCDGVHLVDADNDVERHRLAPTAWKALPAVDLGAHSYVDILYGHSPRCLAYVAARGKQRSGPSLLKMDTGAFSPEDIGAALVRLTGRSEALEFEQEQRRKLARQFDELTITTTQHQQKWEAEEKVVEGVRVRRKIRAGLDEGEKLWRQHLARGLLDTIDRRRALEQQGWQVEREIARLAKELRMCRDEEKALADDVSVHERAQDAQDAHARADERLTEATREETTLSNKIGELREQMSRLEQQGARSARVDVDTAKRALANCTSEQRSSALKLAKAVEVVEGVRLALAEAEEGRTGDAGLSISILVDAGVPAVGLLDAVEVADGFRDVWEPRLHPWRAAVCVDDELHDDALSALVGCAGAVLIAGRAADADIVLPEGILAAPRSAWRFLVELATRVSPIDVADVRAVRDDILGAVVVGGFVSPTTGRVQLVAALRDRLQQVEEEHAAAESAAELAADRETDALTELNAARAAADYEHCLRERRRIEQDELPKIRQLVQERANKRKDALEVLTSAVAKVEGIEAARARAHTNRQEAHNKHSSAKKERATIQQAWESAALDYWLSGLPGGEADARLILNWTTQPAQHDGQDGVARPAASSDALVRVTRSREVLARRANEELSSILGALGVQRDSGQGAPTVEIAEAVRHREVLNDRDQPPASPDEAGFTVLASALRNWLDQHVERDRLAEEQIEIARGERAKERRYVETNLGVLQESLHNVQDSLEQRVEANLTAISDALDRLNRSASGYGATLNYEVYRPVGPEETWTWRVTPAWRRSPNGRMLPYDSATNTAQEKLFSIHLVLAALLASPHPRGRVLILDELGDSLGDEHRRDVLSAVAQVARDHGITVLGTCQDAVMPDAASYCGEILYFCYPSKADALNLPTRMFGFDNNGARVALTVDHLITSRTSS